MIRSYREVRRLRTFEERYEYLKVGSKVGAETFGFERWINQEFYRSREWKDVRMFVIARDEGLDLGVPGHEVFDRVIIHHMNPMTVDDIEHNAAAILDPNFLITTSHRTHNAIHYGDSSLLMKPFVERRPGDTVPWR